MSDPVQSEPVTTDTEQMFRLLELELVQKRAAWKQAKQRNKSLRSMAFLFVFLLFAAGVLGAFFVFTRVNEEKQNHPVPASGR
jgi:hypothetical protein